MAREFDLVLFGATGFVGRLVVEHLVARHGSVGSLRWAIAGRDQSRLEALRTELKASYLPILTADAANAEQLLALTGRTRVLCTTAGPYALCGSELVAACAANGTHYCDITGEIPWIREMIDLHGEEAQETGARLVHCCGFDSIPSDLGSLMINEAMQHKAGGPCDELKFFLKNARGGFSGGTVASLLNIVEQARHEHSLRRLLADPYALDPRASRRGPRVSDQTAARWDQDVQSWTAPYLMGPVNTRIVRRSNALTDYAYGLEFRYSEALMTGTGVRGRLTAATVGLAMRSFMMAAAIKPIRTFMQRRFLPVPGEGPSAQERAAGFFDIRLVGKRGGVTVRGRISGDRDPGYGATAKMLGEAAVALVAGDYRDDMGGGSLTPAACFGTKLIPALQEHAGLQFIVE